jgi:hypothetical protein
LDADWRAFDRDCGEFAAGRAPRAGKSSLKGGQVGLALPPDRAAVHCNYATRILALDLGVVQYPLVINIDSPLAFIELR